jgi:alginate O-acetyltransferase complex protein AlgI
MSFVSFEYLGFLLIAAAVYFSLPSAWRTPFLAAISIFFYMTFVPVYILVLAALIAVDYTAGVCLSKTSGRTRGAVLGFSIIANLGVLAFFKYFNFFGTSIRDALAVVGVPYVPGRFTFLLPVGLSFHTFQSMAYVFEVYRGTVKAERNPVTYAAYVLFFPQLVAGPIERPAHLLPQLHGRHRPEYRRVADGAGRILWGIFKKKLIADRIGGLVYAVFADPRSYSGFTVFAAAVLFSIQIYADFSGYCDIAIGSAKILGFDLSENFHLPYLASSVRDFWRRWHISLSTWFRDYVYIPLGGNRLGIVRTAVNTMAVFCLSGLWHGANWSFVAWGAIHGLCISLEIIGSRYIRVPAKAWIILRPLATATTFAVVCLAWIMFRMQDVQLAYVAYGRLLHGGWTMDFRAFSDYELRIALVAALVMALVEWLQTKPSALRAYAGLPTPVRWLGYYAIIAAILLFSVYQQYNFIYFQF